MIKVSPSLLSADFSKLADEIKTVNNADYIHVDVMDGIFVPNITIGIPVIKSLSKVTDIPMDVHLMISNPQRYLKNFLDSGANILTLHYESCSESDLHNSFEVIKSYGAKAGITLKPGTDIKELDQFLNEVDMVLIMTVEPGFGGQKFMPDMLEKIRYIREISDVDIEVDGGVNYDTAKMCIEAGANILVAGSYIFNSNNRKEAINGLLSIKS